MATIDKKKGQPVEEHSLSSFDKKRGKVLAFSAQKKKKYRVVSVQKIERSDTYGSIGRNVSRSENTAQSPKHSETLRKFIYGTNSGNGSNRSRSYLQGQGKSESAVSELPRNISPEMAERMKRAAYMDKLNKDKIQIQMARTDEVITDYAEKHTENAVTVPHSGYEDKKPYEHKYLSESSDSVIPKVKRAITPEMAERMKRAAFIEQKNAEAIRLNRATVVDDAEGVSSEHYENREQTEEITSDVPLEHSDEAPTEKPTSAYLGNSDKAVFDTYNSEVRAYRAKKAYSDFHEKRKNTVSDSIVGTAFGSEKKKVFNDTPNVSQTVTSSDSVGTAVLDVSSTLAAIEAKKMVKKLAETDFKKEKRVADRMKNHGNRFGIGSDHKDEVEKDKNEKIIYSNDKSRQGDEASSEKQRSSKIGNGIKLKEEKQEYAKKQKSKEIRNKRKELFIKENDKVSGSVVQTAKGGFVRKVVVKKAGSLILGGGALTIAVPILIVVLVYILISAFFGWLSPFSYSLAGEETDPSTGLPTEHKAETKAEVIDGYTKMVKNYLDITQAYYYLNYGDWYGGTYQFEASSIDFGTFFAEYCQKLVAEIQAKYEPMIANAPNPQIAMAISNAMADEINAVLADARDPALEEYSRTVSRLDDELTPSETRQPYEFAVINAVNGIDDAAEFNGMPVVGTNHFGNTEINSDLSAEEMLAYIALYKSLITMNPDEVDVVAPNPDDDSEEVKLNITPQDIMDFFEKTEYFSVTTEVTHNMFCTGLNCKRMLVADEDGGMYWDYYCDADHDNLSGEVGACPTADELLEKIITLTNAEENGIDAEQGQELIDSYIEMFKKELDIDEGDFRKFGAADNSTAKEYYQMLIDGELTGSDIWTVDTPIDGEEENEEG